MQERKENGAEMQRKGSVCVCFFLFICLPGLLASCFQRSKSPRNPFPITIQTPHYMHQDPRPSPISLLLHYQLDGGLDLELAVQEVRAALAHRLRPGLLEDVGVVSALRGEIVAEYCWDLSGKCPVHLQPHARGGRYKERIRGLGHTDHEVDAERVVFLYPLHLQPPPGSPPPARTT